MNKMVRKDLETSISEDIRMMLFGLGDCPKPLEATALMFEDILNTQINLMLKKADKIANRRGALQIEYKDILFMIRKDKLKLQRLINYITFQDEKEEIKKNMTGYPCKEEDTNNTEICLQFLTDIGVEATNDKYRQQQDPILLQRELRANGRSYSYPLKIYNEYIHARRIAFKGKNERSEKFAKWLKKRCDYENIDELIKSPMVFDMICFLSKEMISEIVDMVFLLRRDKFASPGDPESSANVVDTHSILRQEMYNIETRMESIRPITTDEIQEVILRFFSGEFNCLKKFNPIACSVSKNEALITS